MLKIEEMLAIVKEEAQRLKIVTFDVSGSLSEECNVKVADSKPGQMTAFQRNSVSVRVWNEKNLPGFAATTALDRQGLAEALRSALDTSVFSEPEHAAQLATDALLPAKTQIFEPPPLENAQTLLAALMAAEKQVLESHEAIKGVPYNSLSNRNSTRFYVASNGAKRIENYSGASCYLYSRTEEVNKKPRSGGAHDSKVSFAQLDLEGCIKKTIHKTIRHLDYKKIPSGNYTVVFSSSAFLDLLGAFSNVFNAQSVLDKESLSTEGCIGTQIASSLLHLKDDALNLANPNRTSFDGEGVPTQSVQLLTAGVLSSFLHSSGTAKRMKVAATGHARMGSKIGVGNYFYVVEPAVSTLPKRSLKTEKCIVYIDELEALHAGVNSLQGSFSLPISGWIYENGKSTSIESATVAGDFLQTLKSIVYLGDTFENSPSGICPDVWVDNLAITSETA